jgi:uncharacterized protein YciI
MPSMTFANCVKAAAARQTVTMYFLLFYDYVDNIVERRAPHREAHLSLVREYVARGEVVLAGAFADPVNGATFVFKVDDKTTVEAFVAKDPYVVDGLVTAWRIRAWTVVVGSAL